jgi:hypothetical protein
VPPVKLIVNALKAKSKLEKWFYHMTMTNCETEAPIAPAFSARGAPSLAGEAGPGVLAPRRSSGAVRGEARSPVAAAEAAAAAGLVGRELVGLHDPAVIEAHGAATVAQGMAVMNVDGGELRGRESVELPDHFGRTAGDQRRLDAQVDQVEGWLGGGGAQGARAGEPRVLGLAAHHEAVDEEQILGGAGGCGLAHEGASSSLISHLPRKS